MEDSVFLDLDPLTTQKQKWIFKIKVTISLSTTETLFSKEDLNIFPWYTDCKANKWERLRVPKSLMEVFPLQLMIVGYWFHSFESEALLQESK